MINLDDYDGFGEEKAGGSGGAKKKAFGSDARDQRIAEAAKRNREINRSKKKEAGKRSPLQEVENILIPFVKEQESDFNSDSLKVYLDWIEKNINNLEIIPNESEFGIFEKMTPHLGAGGGGKDTSNNARARTHIPTGIRIGAHKEGRGAEANEQAVMRKFGPKLNEHVNNWRIVIASWKLEHQTKEFNFQDFASKYI